MEILGHSKTSGSAHNRWWGHCVMVHGRVVMGVETLRKAKCGAPQALRELRELRYEVLYVQLFTPCKRKK